ncbi:uncharacterized protein LOC119688119 [Teleopsis dalmanni]|uniref:uncharacterized protein LOC119688119 n=1 Tax=Teleopsis dalmanni TaxID=139649 RepID=UPI0018CEC173|nr:uncharacterized protein LOC119688119 [Teleopsis dalmanni]
MTSNIQTTCPTANNRNSTKSDTTIRVEEEYFESTTDTVVDGKSQKKLTQQRRVVDSFKDNSRENGGKNTSIPTLVNSKPFKPLTVSKKVFQPTKALTPKVYGKNTTTTTVSEVKSQKADTEQIKCHKFVTTPKCPKTGVPETRHPKMHMISKYVAPLGRIFKLDNNAAHIITQSKQAGMWQSYKLSSLDPLSRKVKELIVGEQKNLESKVEEDNVHPKPTTCTAPNSESVFGYSDNFLHKVFQPNVNPFENQCLKLVRLGVQSHPQKRDLHYTHITVDKFPRSSYRPDICTIEKLDPNKTAIFEEEERLGTLQ